MEQQDAEFLKRLLSLFKIEAQEHLNVIAAGLAELERCDGDAQGKVVERIFREAHSLKGAACSVNWSEIVAVCQALEDVFSALKRKEVVFAVAMKERLLESVDWLERLIGGAAVTAIVKNQGKDLVRQLTEMASGMELAQPAAERTPEREAEMQPVMEAAAKTVPPAETVRMSIAKLDSLLLQAEELLLLKMAARQRVTEIGEIARSVGEWRKRRNREAMIQDAEFAAGLQKRLQQLKRTAEEDSRNAAGMVDTLLADIKQALMLTVGAQLDGFSRLVRELARESGKQAELIIEGGEVEVDRRVLEEMKDPLLHLLRNAMAHGIEDPALRSERGKPASGTIWIRVQAKDSRLELTVADDGAGIDALAVKNAAIERGVISQQDAELLDAQAALQLILHSEVSTAQIITDNAGRGLGMAIVREKIEKLNGALQIETQCGKGTTFRLELPISLATFRGLVVNAEQQSFIFPVDKVERVARIACASIGAVERCEMTLLDGRPIAFVRLADVLGLNKAGRGKGNGNSGYWPVILLQSAGRSIAFAVDEVQQEMEVLAKPLGRPLLRVPNIAAVAVLGNGKVVPILHVPDLMQSALQRAAAPLRVEMAEIERKTVLVVDDSITARMMMKNILESAGLNVITAVDGAEALMMLENRNVSLVVSDVNMPRLDGFCLTAKIRSDAKNCKLPVVLVTSLEERADRERGIEVGADAYIAKSSFERTNLLAVVERLL